MHFVLTVRFMITAMPSLVPACFWPLPTTYLCVCMWLLLLLSRAFVRLPSYLAGCRGIGIVSHQTSFSLKLFSKFFVLVFFPTSLRSVCFYYNSFFPFLSFSRWLFLYVLSTNFFFCFRCAGSTVSSNMLLHFLLDAVVMLYVLFCVCVVLVVALLIMFNFYFFIRAGDFNFQFLCDGKEENFLTMLFVRGDLSHACRLPAMEVRVE